MRLRHHNAAFAAASLLCVGAMSTAASAYSFKTTEDGTPLRWANGHVAYVIDAAMARDIDAGQTLEAVHGAFDAWAGIDGVALTASYQGRAEGQAIGYDADHPDENVNLVTWSRDSWAHAPEALAVTVSVYRASTGELVDADIIVNEAHYNWGMGGEAENDLQNALTHEVGHLLGLGHAPEIPEATMYPSASPGELEKRDLHDSDIEAISTLYPGEGGPITAKADEAAEPSAPEAPAPAAPAAPAAQATDDGFSSHAGGCDTTSGRSAPWAFLLAFAVAELRRRSRGVKS